VNLYIIEGYVFFYANGGKGRGANSGSSSVRSSSEAATKKYYPRFVNLYIIEGYDFRGWWRQN